MNIGRIAGGAALLGGTALAGGAATYATLTAAGESDGSGPAVWGMGGGSGAMLGAGVGATGFALAATTGRSRGPLVPLLAVPAGIAGGMAGAALARAGLAHRHKEEYDGARRAIDATMVRTQTELRQAGANEGVLGRVKEQYDRTFFNAAYRPRSNDILVGRFPQGGKPLAIDDVVAHEFTHKVVHEYAPQLLSRGGDGRAIHESLSDTVAMLVDRDDWTIGEDAVPGGVRSFSNPEVRGAIVGGVEHPAPISKSQLASTTEAHLAAGVGNKAAYRIGSQLGRDAMGRIYVAALERRELGAGATYADLARIVRAAAADLYGADAHEAKVVDGAWREAGY